MRGTGFGAFVAAGAFAVLGVAAGALFAGVAAAFDDFVAGVATAELDEDLCFFFVVAFKAKSMSPVSMNFFVPAGERLFRSSISDSSCGCKKGA